MPLRTPDFWYAKPGLAATLLSPAALVYRLGRALHVASAKPKSAGIPVICIGNLTAGGGGKTPTALAVMSTILRTGIAKRPAFLSRGYGGSISGPALVNGASDDASIVGDEPMLLARVAPTIVSANRADGAGFAASEGYDLLIMDDGFQNPSIKKDLSLIVIDGAAGLGNGRLLPAGPLREPITAAIKRADAVILIGQDDHNVAALIKTKLVFRATLRPRADMLPPSGRYLAFCGLARPEKFRRTLSDLNVELADFRAFPDHYAFTNADLDALAAEAMRKNVKLITTEKDFTRLPPAFTETHSVVILPVELAWDDPGQIETLLKDRLP